MLARHRALLGGAVTKLKRLLDGKPPLTVKGSQPTATEAATKAAAMRPQTRGRDRAGLRVLTGGREMRWFTVAGLVADIIGVVLVWRFGLPQKEISRSGAKHLATEDTDPVEKALARRYDWLAGFGLALLIAGFFLQLIGSWPK